MPGLLAESNRDSATLFDAAGIEVGTVKVNGESRGGVRIRAEVSGLPAGFHGSTSTRLARARRRLRPPAGTGTTGQTHPSHAGDQPVLLANSGGRGSLSFVSDRYNVADLFDADGNAFIVHALPDNYANVSRYGTPDATTLATGDAGGRIACGVIHAGG